MKAGSTLANERAPWPGREGRSTRGSGEVRALPRVSPFLLRWFTAYGRWYLRRHFHTVRLSIADPRPEFSSGPVVLYANHASWWDPLVGLFLSQQLFGGRRFYAPMEAAALRRYGFFERLGFFGVEPGTRRGASQFLRVSQQVLQEDDTLLAITPQGHFADVRERPVTFQGGLGHLAARLEGQGAVTFVAMAVEYVFWEERLPEVLVRLSRPMVLPAPPLQGIGAHGYSALFERELEQTMDALAAQSRARQVDGFQILDRGGAGQGGVYDWWRSVRAWLRKESYQREHGRL
jgi:1-acyl-sn-glycerol-3-phosphate acyltransferase